MLYPLCPLFQRTQGITFSLAGGMYFGRLWRRRVIIFLRFFFLSRVIRPDTGQARLRCHPQAPPLYPMTAALCLSWPAVARHESVRIRRLSLLCSKLVTHQSTARQPFSFRPLGHVSLPPRKSGSITHTVRRHLHLPRRERLAFKVSTRWHVWIPRILQQFAHPRPALFMMMLSLPNEHTWSEGELPHGVGGCVVASGQRSPPRVCCPA